MLSKADVEQYRKDGYVVAKSVLDKAELATLRGKLQELLRARAGSPGTRTSTIWSPATDPTTPGSGGSRRRISSSRSFASSPRTRRCCRILQQLLGPAVRLHGSKINIKSPQYGVAGRVAPGLGLLSAHQRRCPCGRRHARRLHDRERAADDPAGHPYRASLRSSFDGYFAGATDPARYGLDPSNAVALTGTGGSMSFHHARVLHGSAQNISTRSRWLLLYEFSAADAWPLSGVSDLAEFDGRLSQASRRLSRGSSRCRSGCRCRRRCTRARSTRTSAP